MRFPVTVGIILLSLSNPALALNHSNSYIAQTAQRLTTVTIYTANPQCQSLIPQRVRVPADRPINAAVGQVIMRVRIPGFKLAGYSVNFKRDRGEVTVDFRLAQGSKRFVSFSSCEQFILFGSLRQTLTRNTQWRVKTVRFTELGREIRL